MSKQFDPIIVYKLKLKSVSDIIIKFIANYIKKCPLFTEYNSTLKNLKHIDFEYFLIFSFLNMCIVQFTPPTFQSPKKMYQ